MNASSIGGTFRQFRNAGRFGQDVATSGPRLHGVNIQDAGAHNRNVILHAIRADGPVGRRELAERTGLTPPAVFKITKILLEEQLVVGTRARDGGLGQPPSMLVVNKDAAFTLGLNIDRDHLTLVALDFAGQVRSRFRRDVSYAGKGEVRAFFQDCIDQLTTTGDIPMSKISGVGLAAPDPLDRPFPRQSELDLAWSLNSWRSAVAGLVDAPVFHENDAAAAAIGEMLFGAGLEASSFFYLFVSVGLGGGLVIDRHYNRGAHGHGGEIGLWPQVNPFRSSRTDLCRTVEEIVSLCGLRDALRRDGIGDADLNGLDLQDPAVAHCIETWISGCADLLYAPLLSIICILDPEAIFVGGQLPRPVTEALCREISKRLSVTLGSNWPKMVVRPGLLTSEPAAVGAAVLAFREIWEPAA